jgi:hypothetical protein
MKQKRAVMENRKKEIPKYLLLSIEWVELE